jgi:hypothetical protein
MNEAVKKSAAKIAETLKLAGNYRKIDNHLFVIRQGSAYVMISVAPWGEERALVRFVAQVVVGVRISGELALDLLRRNASLRFGAFAFFQKEQVIALTHTLLGGKTLDGDEILAAARDLALVADSIDEELMIAHGGRRMQDVIEEESIKSIAEELDQEPDAIKKAASQPVSAPSKKRNAAKEAKKATQDKPKKDAAPKTDKKAKKAAQESAPEAEKKAAKEAKAEPAKASPKADKKAKAEPAKAEKKSADKADPKAEKKAAPAAEKKSDKAEKAGSKSERKKSKK